MTSMVEKVAAACRAAVAEDRGRTVSFEEMSFIVARAAIKAMRDPDDEMLEAMHKAMFADEFTGTELPMLGAGFEAAIDAALSETGER